MRKSQFAAALAAASIAIPVGVLSAGPVNAATVNFTRDVSCNSGIWTNLYTATTTGSISLTQNSSNPYSATKAHLQSTLTGRNTSDIIVFNGQTKGWTGVIHSNYRLWGTRDNTTDCNGAGLGKGNYTYYY